MNLIALFLLYFVSAAILVFFSVKCANYVDLLDKKTSISGAFIGGVILAAVTSLPELVTSISSIYVVNNAELIIGNVLGSNIFNLCIFGALTAVAVKGYSHCAVGKSHMATLICTLVAYAATAAVTLTGFGTIPVIHINVVSLAILVVYIISFRFLSHDESDTDEPDTCTLTVKQIIIRFVLMALGLVAMSVVVTYLTDQLSEKLALNASLAGALFLGIATSLPELTSSITLVRLKNYNAMVGNVAGSNMFNFAILSIADIIAGQTAIYVFSPQTGFMLLFGVVSTLLAMLSLGIKYRAKTPLRGGALAVYVVPGVLILVSYVAFLVLSM